MPCTCSALYSFLLFLLYSFQRTFKLGHTVYQEAYEDTGGESIFHFRGETTLFYIKSKLEYIMELNTECVCIFLR